MRLKKLVLLGVSVLSLGTTGAVLAQPVQAHAATAIPARFRHTWQGQSGGTLYTFKIHKYYGNLHESSEWHDYRYKVYFKRYTKNNYTAYFYKPAQPFGLSYINSHKLHLIYGPGKHAYFSLSRI